MPARLKWPNDVLLNGRKAAGVLTGTGSTELGISHVVIGIGVNVHQPADAFSGELSQATSLYAATGTLLPRSALAAALCNSLDRWYAVLTQGRIEPLLTAGRERSATLGRPVEVRSATECWQGDALDLDSDGALIVRRENGEVQRVMAGDVSALAHQ